MKTKHRKTFGSISRAIARAFQKWERDGKPGPMPNWVQITKRHIDLWGRSRGKKSNVIGPFGLRCAISITVGRKTREVELHNTRGWHFGKRDYKAGRDGSFRPNSIGALNNLDYPYVEIPSSTPLAKEL